jgi:hypothetical protein
MAPLRCTTTQFAIKRFEGVRGFSYNRVRQPRNDGNEDPFCSLHERTRRGSLSFATAQEWAGGSCRPRASWAGGSRTHPLTAVQSLRRRCYAKHSSAGYHRHSVHCFGCSHGGRVALRLLVDAGARASDSRIARSPLHHPTRLRSRLFFQVPRCERLPRTRTFRADANALRKLGSGTCSASCFHGQS